MEIKLTTTESEMYFYNALCNGLDYMGGYGLDLEYDKQAYINAKAKLTNPCYEDVLMQILKDGGTLTIVDLECDGEYTSTINIQDVHERVAKTQLNHLMNMVNGEDDAETGDVILQTVFFSEIVFG